MCNMNERCEDVGAYRWHGPYFPGAMSSRRKEKELEARARNALTLPGRRRKTRLLAQHQRRMELQAAYKSNK